MTSEHAPEWVNVREGSAAGPHAPRTAHLVDWPRFYTGRCGFAFTLEDVARTAQYPHCRRCSELAAPTGGGVLAFTPIPDTAELSSWVITRSNPDDWGLYRDGRLYTSVKTLAEAERIIAEREATS